MAYSPTDVGKDFVESGMTLISQPASDRWLKKVKRSVPNNRLSRPCGGVGGFDDFVERFDE